jgi:hypothetical protein
VGSAGTQFTCFTSTKVQILTRCSNGRWRGQRSTHFTCFTNTKVQILTPEEQGWSLLDAEIERVQSPQALPRDALLEIEILPPGLYPADAIKKNIKKTPPRGKGEGEGGGLGGLVDEDDESVAILLRGDALHLSKCSLIFFSTASFFFSACMCVCACMASNTSSLRPQTLVA